MKSQSRARLLVLLSGSGRTLLNLADAIDRDELDAEIALVVASRECLGQQRAHARGLATRVLAGRLSAEQMLTLVEASGADVVVLAGYLHLVPVPSELRGRIVNIHPALLPEFGGPGMHGLKVHEAVLRAGRTTSGCTVHLCDERYDTGPILLQRTCPVFPDDTPETLAARVFEQECIAYPQALNDLIAQRVSSGEP